MAIDFFDGGHVGPAGRMLGRALDHQRDAVQLVAALSRFPCTRESVHGPHQRGLRNRRSPFNYLDNYPIVDTIESDGPAVGL